VIRSKPWLFWLTAAALSVSFATAQDSPAKQERKESLAITDPAKAGPDFAIQGEYVGEIEHHGKAKIGVQVIALGDGKFHLRGCPGGLPGAGWIGKEVETNSEGELKDGAVIFREVHKDLPPGTGDIVASYKDGQIIAFKGEKTIGALKKVDRKSPALGAKPPKDAVVLFDGTSAENFDGKMTEDKLLMHGATSKRKFQSCTLHVEFQLPFMPYARGQGRGNSGVYLQGRYEVQILDSFGLKGDNHECGGVYEVRDPDLNMCFPPLAWQTYDIDFTAAEFNAAGKKLKNAHMLVKHNGVVIHEHLDLPKATLAHTVPEGPEPGPLYLQDHGNPVQFRNIWLVEKK
jgi:hypothetical protein